MINLSAEDESMFGWDGIIVSILKDAQAEVILRPHLEEQQIQCVLNQKLVLPFRFLLNLSKLHSSQEQEDICEYLGQLEFQEPTDEL